MPTSSIHASPSVTWFAARAGDRNDRAMAGSFAIAEELSRRLGSQPTVIGRPEQPLDADWGGELDAARPALAAMSTQYERILTEGSTPFTALSRCAVALATLPMIARFHPNAVVVWFDAHADLQTPETTTTGYLGGMALSGPLGLWDSGLGAGLDPTRTILAGVRDIDPPERTLIERGMATLVAPGDDFAGRLAAAIAGRPVYVHIDCDVLDPDIVPTEFLVPGGLSLDDLHDAAAVLASSGVHGLELGEFEAASSANASRAAARRLLDALQPIL